VNEATGSSPALLTIASLEGRPGDAGTEGAFSHTVQSDVLTRGTVFEDIGRVRLALTLRDAGTMELPTRPSPLNAVTVDRYRVRYWRADGRNVPGVDLPHAFDGAMTMTVGAEEVTGSVVLVRAQAKLEPPLIGLRDFQSGAVVSTLAEVTFFGRDQTGHVATATGFVGINFANWADAE
jgi:hypothetical protein